MKTELFNKGFFSVAEKEFEAHLNYKDNTQILFSGPFGSGKTSFLQYFFQEAKAGQAYKVFALSPVNYSIAGNDDIVKYIKYDVLGRMVDAGLEFEYEPRALPKAVLKVIGQAYKDGKSTVFDILFKSFVPPNPLVDSSALTKLMSIVNNVRDFLTEPIKSTEETAVDDFVDSISTIESGLYHHDPITGLINTRLERMKIVEGEQKTQSVLIIDDLDRIDPEHIFRILNVFSAHVNPFTSSVPSALKFDKVIVVCDIDNLRTLFQHKYGFGKTFNGYIDKFYSHHVFHYPYEKAVEDFSRSIIGELTVEDRYGRPIRNHERLSSMRETSELLHHLLIFLGKTHAFTFRALSKVYGSVIRFDSDNDNPCVPILRFILKVFGHSALFKGFMRDLPSSVIFQDESMLISWCYNLVLATTTSQDQARNYSDINGLRLRRKVGDRTLTFVFAQDTHPRWKPGSLHGENGMSASLSTIDIIELLIEGVEFIDRNLPEAR